MNVVISLVVGGFLKLSPVVSKVKLCPDVMALARPDTRSLSLEVEMSAIVVTAAGWNEHLIAGCTGEKQGTG